MQIRNKRINWVLLLSVTLAAVVITNLGAGGRNSQKLSANFDMVPETVGDYRSTNLRLDKTSLRMLTPDAYLARNYHAENGRSLDFLVIYGRNKSTFHSPGYCLTGSGWDVVNKWEEPVSLVLRGRQQECRFNYMEMKKHDKTMLVAWCFVERGRVVSSLIWMNWYLLYDGLVGRGASGALVRVMIPIHGSAEETNKILHGFIGKVLPPVVEAVYQGRSGLK